MMSKDLLNFMNTKGKKTEVDRKGLPYKYINDPQWIKLESKLYNKYLDEDNKLYQKYIDFCYERNKLLNKKYKLLDEESFNLLKKKYEDESIFHYNHYLNSNYGKIFYSDELEDYDLFNKKNKSTPEKSKVETKKSIPLELPCDVSKVETKKSILLESPYDISKNEILNNEESSTVEEEHMSVLEEITE